MAERLMTTDEIMTELRSDSPLNRARAVFSGWAARIEQEGMQRKPIGPIEVRGLEFQAAKAIVNAFNDANSKAIRSRLALLAHDLNEIHSLLSKAISEAEPHNGTYRLPWSVISWSRDAAGRGTETLDEVAGPICKACLGRGIVDNPEARYEMDRDTGNYETNDAEEIECPDCEGSGLVDAARVGAADAHL